MIDDRENTLLSPNPINYKPYCSSSLKKDAIDLKIQEAIKKRKENKP